MPKPPDAPQCFLKERPPKRFTLSIQYALDAPHLPRRPLLRDWVRTTLKMIKARGGEITLRFVDSEESQGLNRDFRGKDKPTNVLSFPYETEPKLSGDLILCTPILIQEAAAQQKSLEAHCAHLIVHGLLHLHGHDHEDNEAADVMEALESTILAALGFPSPYAEI